VDKGCTLRGGAGDPAGGDRLPERDEHLRRERPGRDPDRRPGRPEHERDGRGAVFGGHGGHGGLVLRAGHRPERHRRHRPDRLLRRQPDPDERPGRRLRHQGPRPRLVPGRPQGGLHRRRREPRGGERRRHRPHRRRPQPRHPELVAPDLADHASGQGAAGPLFEVPADAHEAQPEKLGIGGVAGQGGGQSPTVGNTWPAVSGRFGGGVYEHDNGTDTEVYIRDDYLRQQSWAGIKDAAEPDYVLVGGSATSQGTPEVVFVRRVGGHEHVFEQNILTGTGTGGSAAAARDLTPNATADCTEPALSADGKTVAYSTPTGVFTISATGSGTPAQVTGTPGFPAFRSGS
jgi:hypothetical protein